ncbi:Imidazolonepropionase [bioreactor metagenome]|uniref:Imidazolonepropionase n=1 Tax=bioreactor metagenome TaxID=1076179 RepID=A0A644XPL6_9ZZZZ
MKTTLLRCGKLFDGLLDRLQSDMEILVCDDRIAEVGRHLPVPEQCEIVDLSDKTVTPGMIDAHVHADAFDNDKMFMETIFASSTYRALGTLHTLQHSLHRGFTSIRVPGTIEPFDYGIADVARAVERGYFEGSRLVFSFGALGTPGGHTDLSQRLYENPMLAELYTSKVQGLGNGADFFRGAVRQQIKYGAGFIKIMASGGFASPNDSPEDKQLTDEELAAIIGTAHQLGKTCTAHVYAPYVMQCLLRLGIDGMEHGSLMDEKTAELFEKQGTYLVPTFLPYEEIINPDEEKLAKKEPVFQRKLRLYQDRLQRSREVICQSNIRLGYGTDLVAVYQPYENGQEYACWLRSGMNPFRALKAATSVNAQILGLDEVGTIEKGKLADIAAWNRDLLTDEKALLDCAFVMKNGDRYEPESGLSS